jgi:2-keto-4-pentenoate hydratase/2-oxohepta-3-ene-1,7-dioic acid hydratase in catechol pathway
MQLATFQLPGGRVVAAARLDAQNPFRSIAECQPDVTTRLIDFLSAGDSASTLVRSYLAGERGTVIPSEARPLAPIPRPGKVFGVGLNYRDHAAEQGAKVPSEPVIFAKLPTSITGPGAAIPIPSEATEVDFEAELVIVIGKRGRRISREAAMDHVAGYTCGNDVSARDWQHRKDGKQWVLGKSFDGFGPTGPWIVTADTIPDPHALDISMTVSGEVMQSSNTRELIFPVPDLLVYLSKVATLEPGDLIFTGTPSGVGFARKPPRFLAPGDRCAVTIAGIGTLENPCVAD